MLLSKQKICAYHSNQEFLEDILSFWNMLLSMLEEICKYNGEHEEKLFVRGMYVKQSLIFCSDNEPQLEISEEIVKKVSDADTYILERASLSSELPPLLRLRKEMNLNIVEYMAFLAALAYDHDVHYHKFYASLQDGTDIPTVALCCAAASLFRTSDSEGAINRFISGTSPILQMFFIQGEKAEIVGRIRRPLFLTERALRFLLDGDQIISDQLQKFCRYSQCDTFKKTCIHHELIRQMQRLIDYRQQLCIILCGMRGSGKRSAIQTAISPLQRGILYLNIDTLMQSGTQFASLINLLKAELFFTEGILCLQTARIDEALKTAQYIERLLHELSEASPLVFVTSETSGAELKHLQYPKAFFEMPLLMTEDKMAIWESADSAPQLESGFSLEKLLSHYMLNIDEVNRITVSAQHYAVLDGRELVSESDVIRAVKLETARNFGNIAEPIPTVFRMEDILLSPEQEKMFYHIAHIYQNQNSVYEQWNMKRQFPYGTGFCILFYGSPGTGKTMGAQVLANLLEYPLYRVDLSQIVSKYIGETEKNITRLFEYAKNVNCVLFFDEADALFSKRAEVKDSHDKNANATTAHLLQKIENFSGIAILATNYIQNIDDAFRRRIRFSVSFGFPSQSEREQLWNKILPAQEFRENIDIPYLAQMFELTGSNIKEIIANACCMAYADGSLLTMKYIAEALRMNYNKHNKAIPLIPY